MAERWVGDRRAVTNFLSAAIAASFCPTHRRPWFVLALHLHAAPQRQDADCSTPSQPLPSAGGLVCLDLGLSLRSYKFLD